MKSFFLWAYGILGLIALTILISIFIWYVFNEAKDDIEDRAWYKSHREDNHG